MRADDVEILECPAKLPDLNTIQNVQDYLESSAYAKGRKFDNVQTFQTTVMAAYNSLDQQYIRSLYHTLSSQLILVVKGKGSLKSSGDAGAVNITSC